MCNINGRPGFGISRASIRRGIALKSGSTEETTTSTSNYSIVIIPYLLHGRRYIAARLKSDDHSRQERGGLGDRGGVVNIHA